MNRLADETSPYLRQHADNPVDWYPWGAGRLRRRQPAGRAHPAVGRLLGLPLVPCHGPRVLRGSRAAAEVMNAGFVNIKVDREERPDVDSHLHGGGPGHHRERRLADDGVPAPRRPALPRAAPTSPGPASWTCSARSRRAWRDRRDDLEGDAAPAGRRHPVRDGRCRVAGRPAPRRATRTRLLRGRGGQPGRRPTTRSGAASDGPRSSPRPSMVELVLLAGQHARRRRRTALGAMVTTTLDAMAAGGIYDHLGGGFARYSTERTWLVPHFEKMLYDNAQLARVYLHAWQVTGEDRYRQVVERDARVPAAAAHAARPAAAGLGRGRRQRGRRRPVLRLGRRRGRRRSAAARPRPDWYGVTGAGNWEGHNILLPAAAAPLARARPRWRRPGRPSSTAASAGSGPAWTTRC